MGDRSPPNAEERILILTSRSRDAELTKEVLNRAGISCFPCTNMREVVEELHHGASAVLLPEEAVLSTEDRAFEYWLERQETWSDLPVLVLARSGADSAAVAQAMDLLGNVTVLERPMRISALVSAVRSARRARERQYQIRDHLLIRETIEAKLRADDRRKDEFLAILAHELRNPLAPIRHALDFLAMKGSLTQEDERLRALIERQVNQMVRLVDDLLEISRITRGKIELRKEIVDIATVVSSAIEGTRPLIEKQNHRLSIVRPDRPVYVHGDPFRLGQILSNLLNNAAKYTDASGSIEVKVEVVGGLVELSVTDTGAGISPEMLPRVFEMFAQIDRSLERTQGGLGIGLTLVKNLVELHGGTIDAESEGLGLGCRFTVHLPLAAAEAIVDATGEGATPSRR